MDPSRAAPAERSLALLLQLAYSGERAAGLAYRGHWKSVRRSEERERIRLIEQEEWHHRHQVGEMLAALGAGPRRWRELRALFIGRVLGLLCHLGGWLAPMYGAGKLESRNVGEYESAARLARACGREGWVDCLLTMAEVEWEHERYFRERVQGHWLGRRLRLWPRLAEKGSIRERFLAAGEPPEATALARAGAGTWLLLLASCLASCSSAPRLVAFPTPDGGYVHADDFGTGSHGVVLAHGGRFDRSSWTPQAKALARAGFRALAIDFRGRGQSRGGTQENAQDEIQLDVLAAVRYLRRSGVATVSVVGASLGGYAAARAAIEADEGEIDRQVLLAAPPVERPERLPGRKLFVTTRDDLRGDGIPRLPRIREQFERAPPPKELLVLEGSAHAQFIFETDQGERLLSEILHFLSRP